MERLCKSIRYLMAYYYLLSLFISIHIVKVYCNLATVCAKNTNNIIKIEQAKNLLYKALKTIDNNMKKMHLVEICIHLNLSAILNQLLNYSESIHNIELAYEKLKKSIVHNYYYDFFY